MKDWKCNKNSLRAAIAVKSPNSQNEQQEDDFYATDPAALQNLLDHCSYWLHNQLSMHKNLDIGVLSDHIPGYIWECACGNGNLSGLLIRNGYKVIATDLKDRGYGLKRDMDFLQEQKTWGGIILTNPPYSLATEFIEHALEILPYGGLYIALMNITYLAGQARYWRIYSKGTLRELYVFSKRVECWKNNVPSGHSSIANYAWYVFEKGYKGQPIIYWL